ncbi:GntR family transcriptional regulator [Leucobacter viscericola]|uniref:GntR family transcriptional regulator n=1 Tax=Leucobacter viscericola TaxID=2714935 RepID=A0A6G7XIU0_9MICO|nr:GntR family transcriptional regulator [Leucobacter viscericola]QIK64288.1 GntR family transcriptional regulator [Leucobacter viscericola]
MSAVPSTPKGQSSPLRPLTRPLNLRETVLEQLRTAIITGEIAEGELVSAPTLGLALGVSATPVREAMMDLVREGLVETIKNKGFRVTTMSDSDLDDLAQLRRLIEPPAMQMVVGNIDDSTHAELVELAEACQQAAKRGDLVEYLRDDREFHAFLLLQSGNQQLANLATSLRLRARMYGIATLAENGLLAHSAQEHQQLLELLRSGDAEAAEQLMHEHIAHTRKSWATGTPEAGVQASLDKESDRTT